jgi:hypothetical protein
MARQAGTKRGRQPVPLKAFIAMHPVIQNLLILRRRPQQAPVNARSSHRRYTETMSRDNNKTRDRDIANG